MSRKWNNDKIEKWNDYFRRLNEAMDLLWPGNGFHFWSVRDVRYFKDTIEFTIDSRACKHYGRRAVFDKRTKRVRLADQDAPFIYIDWPDAMFGSGWEDRVDADHGGPRPTGGASSASASASASACVTARDYQREAHRFADYGENAMYPALGLAEEAGEVCGKIAKFIRKYDGTEPATVATPEVDIGGTDIRFTADLRKELGDVLWMVAELCTVYGLDLDDVMRANIEKLADRKERGVIAGEGDNR